MPVIPAPRSLCLLRLSALGDATHAVALVRALQHAWPQLPITWVIGRGEAKLLEGLEGVEFIVYDKKAGLAGWRALRMQLAGRRFDVLLNLQLALRASLVSTAIEAERRIGYDRARSKEGHSLFINERVPAGGHHVLDAFLQFLLPLGLTPGPVEWRLPVPDEAHAWAREQLPGDVPTLLVSPCSSHPLRNWRPERYAAVADHAAANGWRVVICGGRSVLERQTADQILATMRHPALDLVGKDTLKQLLALLQRATLVLTPDSGPTHMANAMGTPVLGLHACTDAERSGPYSDRRWTVNHYDAAARRFLGKPASALRWGRRVEFPGVMDLIPVDEVIARFDAFVAAPPGPSLAGRPSGN
ncbi:glycosyltransferase family 9 protein [Arenimonas terrae]|uniref:Lipopolysaccharide heptosyltransferase family protein n=1 Tax=Arenimonas terrae TaxID=2546226 RepID=A0A5C4RV96_9GAMM|nr:glycosyltransferase family 9 protein [Arenimonas terrae]TNJ35090.1 lipopolysaccharide heptosyltransferase family protein [Arenimonas terrae]